MGFCAAPLLVPVQAALKPQREAEPCASGRPEPGALGRAGGDTRLRAVQGGEGGAGQRSWVRCVRSLCAHQGIGLSAGNRTYLSADRPPVVSGPLVTEPSRSLPTGGHQVPSTYRCLFPCLYSRIVITSTCFPKPSNIWVPTACRVSCQAWRSSDALGKGAPAPGSLCPGGDIGRPLAPGCRRHGQCGLWTCCPTGATGLQRETEGEDWPPRAHWLCACSSLCRDKQYGLVFPPS